MPRALSPLLAVAIVLGVAAARPAPAGSTHLKMIVGVTDDTAKWMTRQDGIVGVHRDLRLMAVRVTIPWRPGQMRPTRLQGVYLHRIARMLQLNDRIVLSVYNVARFAPTTRVERNQYCAFLRSAVRRLPLIDDIEIWNEANSPTYWPQENGPETYAALLARCYDVLHARPGPTNVISSTASRHDPAGFVFALGVSYRLSGRSRPLFDTFGHNPYPENSAEAPWVLHPDSDVLAEGDYETLMNVLQTSFTGRPSRSRAGGASASGTWRTGFRPSPRRRNDASIGGGRTTRMPSPRSRRVRQAEPETWTRRRSCETRSCSPTASPQ